MAFQCKVGAFSSGTGAVNSTIDVTCGFQPQAVILWWSGITGTSDACTFGDSFWGTGFFTQTERAFQSLTDDNGAGSQGSSATGGTSSCVDILQVNSVTLDGRLDVDSFANWPSDGFRLIVDDTMPIDLRIGFIAFGGSDITNVDIISYTETVGSNSPSVGFQPDVIFYLPQHATSAAGSWSFGVATAAQLNACLMGGTDQGSASADTATYCGTEVICATVNTATPTTLQTTTVIDSITSTGWTLTNVGGSVTRNALAIQGGKWKSGTLSTRTDSNGISISGLGGTPKGVLVASGNRTQSSSSGTAPLKFSLGAGTSTSERHAQTYVSQNGSGNMRVVRAVEHDEIYINVTAPGSDGADGASGTVEGLMDVQSVDSDGFTFVMDDTDSSAFFCWYVMCGQAAEASTNMAKAYLPPMPQWSPNVMYSPCT